MQAPRLCLQHSSSHGREEGGQQPHRHQAGPQGLGFNSGLRSSPDQAS